MVAIWTLGWFNLFGCPERLAKLWGSFMTKPAEKKNRKRSNSDQGVSSRAEKARIIKGSIRAAYAITKELENVRKVKPESLLQPMTL